MQSSNPTYYSVSTQREYLLWYQKLNYKKRLIADMNILIFIRFGSNKMRLKII